MAFLAARIFNEESHNKETGHLLLAEVCTNSSLVTGVVVAARVAKKCTDQTEQFFLTGANFWKRKVPQIVK